MQTERRLFTRLTLNLEAELCIDTINYKAKAMKNLSIGGCLLEIAHTFPQGKECTLSITLPHGTEQITVIGEIVRSNKETTSIRFIEIEPESLILLQNLIRFNADDADTIEKEISSHPGLR